MSVVLLLAATLGLLVFAWAETWPVCSPRVAMVRRLGPAPGSRPARPARPAEFRLLQAGLAVAAALLLTGPWWLVGGAPDWGALAIYPPLFWLLPEAWLALHLRRRRDLIARAYLDLLAHLALQTRAGVALPDAFASSWPVLSGPLKGAVAELALDLGSRPFPEALVRFADHCDTPEIRDFVQNVLALPPVDAGSGFAWLLAAEERHALARAGDAMRWRSRAAAPIMAAAAALLVAGGAALYFMPVWLR